VAAPPDSRFVTYGAPVHEVVNDVVCLMLLSVVITPVFVTNKEMYIRKIRGGGWKMLYIHESRWKGIFNDNQ